MRSLCEEGRQLKIDDFSHSLKLKRLESNIRGVFVKNRIKIKMKKMLKDQLFRYTLLVISFKRYVKSFRENVFKQKRRKVTQQLFKSVIKDKVKLGLAACTLSIRKIQKFNEWMVMVRAERKKCLNYMWKVNVLSMMKVNSEHQDASFFHIPKNMVAVTY